jgi:hypothetical protein
MLKHIIQSHWLNHTSHSSKDSKKESKSLLKKLRFEMVKLEFKFIINRIKFYNHNKNVTREIILFWISSVFTRYIGQGFERGKITYKKPNYYQLQLEKKKKKKSELHYLVLLILILLLWIF